MATDGGGTAEYDAAVTSLLLAEAVRVLRAFGFANAHVIVVGGLVPPLLVPRPEPHVEAHVGTQDLDLCLSIALVDGNVGSYDRLEKCLRDAGFTMALEGGRPVSWRWRGGTALPIVVEFFCPAGPDRTAGRLFRPGGQVGGKLSAMTLSAGRLIDMDAREVTIPVDLPGGGGRTQHTLKGVGPAAYLASKADALRRRNKNKDAYDIVWLSEAWPGGQQALAAEIQRSAVAGEPEFIDALNTLGEEFADLDSAGAVKYARFVADDGGSLDLGAQRAVGAVNALLALLPRSR